MAALAAGCTGGRADMSASPVAGSLHPACAQAGVSGGLCIVVLGDSIGVGAPLTGDDRWWPQLRTLLEAALPGRSIAIDNWAVSGSQVDLLGSQAQGEPALASYDVAIVIEGVNDARVGLPIDDWRTRYAAAIAAIESKGPVVVLATPPPSFENGGFSTQFDSIAAAVRDLATARRRVLDLATRWRADGPTIAATYYVDQIHQSASGQRLMARMARDVILDAISG